MNDWKRNRVQGIADGWVFWTSKHRNNRVPHLSHQCDDSLAGDNAYAINEVGKCAHCEEAPPDHILFLAELAGAIVSEYGRRE